MFDITSIVKLLFGILSLIFTVVLVPYIKSKTTTEQRADLLALVKIAVAAAQQLYKGHGQGDLRKVYVVTWLNDRGVTVDMDELDTMIESAVYELHMLTATEVSAPSLEIEERTE